MLPRSIVNELEKNLAYLINSFGGIDTYISYVKELHKISLTASQRQIPESKYRKFINYFYLLLKFKKSISIVSPWSLNIDLRNINALGQIQSNSINTDEPYKVYNLEGDLIYSVAGHQGIFGESYLDKILLNNSYNGHPYYLKYKQQNGVEKIILLVINFYTREVVAPNDLFKSVDNLEYSVVTIGNFTSSTITIYTLESLPIKEFTVTNLIDQGTAIEVDPLSSYEVTVTTGTYIHIEHSSGTAQRTSPSINKQLIEILPSPNLFMYAALNVDVNNINRIFNKTITTTSNKIREVFEVR